MKKNIYVHGSFMNDNFGDYLLYEVVMEELKKHENDFNIFSADVSKTYDDLYQVRRKGKLKSMFSADLAVFAGGGYFGEPDKRKLYWSIRFLLKHALPLSILKLRGIPYAIIGTGVGPLSYLLPRLFVKFLFNGASLVSIRDIESKQYLESIGVKNDIKVIPDWVMSMESNELARDMEKAKKIISDLNMNNTNQTMFVHLTTKNNNDGSGMSLVIDELVNFANENKNVNFIIGCDQARVTQEERAQQIVDKMPSNRTKLLKYKGPWILCSVLNMADMIITDKLHVGIVGTRLYKKVLSFASHSKSLRFYRQLNRSNNSIILSEVTSPKVREQLQNLLHKQEDVQEVKNIYKLAKENKRLLDEFVKSN